MAKPDAIFNVARVIDELVRQMGVYVINTVFETLFFQGSQCNRWKTYRKFGTC